MIERNINEYGELSRLQKILIGGAIVAMGFGLVNMIFNATEPTLRLPSENIAVTNKTNLSSNELNKIVYEKMEIKPYEN